MNTSPPTLGQIIKVYDEPCRVIRVYDAGTCDVESLDGTRHWRITGLGWIKAS